MLVSAEICIVAKSVHAGIGSTAAYYVDLVT